MRITHVIFTRGFAGSERGTAEMCNEQARRHQVSLIIGTHHRSPSGASIVDRIDPAVTVVRLPHVLRDRLLRRALARLRPDVIHTHLGQASQRVAELRTGVPVIATLHNHFNVKHLGVDAVLYIESAQAREIAERFAGRAYHMHNTHVPHRAPTADRIAALRRDAGAEPGDYLVGGAGRLVDYKGFDVLIDAFERAGLPDGRLAVLGEGPEREELERRAGPRTRLLGFREDVRDFFWAFDLFVCPSRKEFFGRVNIEAFEAGAHVIASDVGEQAIYVPELGGEIVPVGDVAALAAAIRRRHGERASRAHPDLGRYLIGPIVARVEAIYAELTGRIEVAGRAGRPPAARHAMPLGRPAR